MFPASPRQVLLLPADSDPVQQAASLSERFSLAGACSGRRRRCGELRWRALRRYGRHIRCCERLSADTAGATENWAVRWRDMHPIDSLAGQCEGRGFRSCKNGSSHAREMQNYLGSRGFQQAKELLFQVATFSQLQYRPMQWRRTREVVIHLPFIHRAQAPQRYYFREICALRSRSRTSLGTTSRRPVVSSPV